MSPVFGSADPTPEKLHVLATHTGGLLTGTGGRLPAGVTIVSVFEVTPDRPFSSRTVRVTVNVPGPVYVRVGTGPVPDPLPKFHEYVSVEGFSSVEERPSNEQTFCAQLNVKFATGGRLVPVPVTVTLRWLGTGVVNPCWSTPRTRIVYAPDGITGVV